MKKVKVVYSDLICPDCGIIFTIPRPVNKCREMFHIKTMHCFCCNKESQFIELHDAFNMKKSLEYKISLNKQEKYIYDLLCMHDEEKVNDRQRILK